MPDKKISELPLTTTPDLAASVPIVQSAANYRTTLEDAVLRVLGQSAQLPFGTGAYANTGTGAANVILGNDSRLTNSRPPSSHASSHQAGGSDRVDIVAFSPATLSADANDYLPSTVADVLYLTASASVNLTGISASYGPKAILLINSGSSGTITLKHDTTSQAANRFLTYAASDVIISSGGDSVAIVYDQSASGGVGRWRVLEASGGGSGGSTDWAEITNKPSSFQPSSHASSHSAIGTDAITIEQSQVNNLTSTLAAKASTSSVSSHVAATASVHGISDTANLVYTSDSRLSDARPPVSHKASHQPAGSDYVPVTFHSPSELSADQNNWNPGTKADVVRVSCSVAVNITGLAASYGPNAVVLVNTGAIPISLAHNSVSSDAANRFFTASGGSFTLSANGGSATLVYDPSIGASGGWRVLETIQPQYTLPVASAGTLGGVRIGNNITVTEDGTISVAAGGGNGTVTSVGLDLGATGLTVNGGSTAAITTSGTFAFGGLLGVSNGGTGASTQAQARTNLGLGTMAVASQGDYLLRSGGTMTGPVVFADPSSNAITVNSTVSGNSAVLTSSSDGSSLSLTANGASQVTVSRFSTDVNAPAATFSKQRGTIASPQAVIANDNLGTFSFQTKTVLGDGTLNPTSQTFAQIRARAAATPVVNGTAVPTVIELRVSSASAATDASLVVSASSIDANAPSNSSISFSAFSATNGSSGSTFSCYRSRSGGTTTLGGDVLGQFRALGRNASGGVYQGGNLLWQQADNATASAALTRAVITANDGVNEKWCVTASPSQVETVCHASSGHLMPMMAVRALIRFDGLTGETAATFNCTLVKEAVVGLYTLTFTQPMPDAAYGVSVSAHYYQGQTFQTGWLITFLSASQLQIQFSSNLGAYDPRFVSIAIFR